MSNNVEDLEEVRLACREITKRLNVMIQKAENFDDPLIITRLMSAQSKVLFAKFAVHEALRRTGRL